MSNNKSVEVKLYLNGFPKSGTHALNSLGAVILPQLTMRNWFGNTLSYAFSTEFGRTDEETKQILDDFIPNRFIKGHLAYTPVIAKAFQDNHICKAFIFRDFRDVAVSTTYHALDREKKQFPNKDFYQTLEFGEVLKRIITGDENIAGVMERWEMFAPWLDEEWVLKITYEDFIEYPKEVAGLFIRYVYGKAAGYHGGHMILDKESFDNAVNRLMCIIKRPEQSATFRNGKIGEWKKYFTDEHIELFKKSDKNNWIERLGYDDRNW